MSQEFGRDAHPVLRLVRLEEVTQGDSDFERELLDCLIAEVSEAIDRLHAAVREPDAPRVAALLHGIVGSCRTLGADALGASSRACETEARHPDFAPRTDWLAPLEREFSRLRDAVAMRLGA